MKKNYIGKDGFIWWIGVVEDRMDPDMLHRVRCRIFGWHVPNRETLPTDYLPWATIMNGANSMLISTLKDGDMVFGFFIDGESAQQPVVVGYFNGIPEIVPDINVGYSDQRTNLGEYPNKPDVTYRDDGSGVTVKNKDAVRNPVYLNEPTSSRLSRGNTAGTVLEQRNANLVEDVPIAGGGSWSEPASKYVGRYPFNHVIESESGHALEIDDTPNAERIGMSHRSGTYFEMFPSGSLVEKITRNRYSLILGENDVYISGHCNITVMGNTRLKSVGDVTVEALNKLDIGVAGDTDLNVGGQLKIKADGIVLESSGSVNIKGDSSVKVSGSSIDLFGDEHARMTGGLSVDILAGLSARMHGLSVAIKKGASSASKASGSGLGSAPDSESPHTASKSTE